MISSVAQLSSSSFFVVPSTFHPSSELQVHTSEERVSCLDEEHKTSLKDPRLNKPGFCKATPEHFPVTWQAWQAGRDSQTELCKPSQTSECVVVCSVALSCSGLVYKRGRFIFYLFFFCIFSALVCARGIKSLYNK